MGGHPFSVMLCRSAVLLLMVAAYYYWAIVEQGQEFSNAKTSADVAMVDSNDSDNDDLKDKCGPADVDFMGVDRLPGRGSDFNAGLGSLVLVKKSGEEDDDFEDEFDTAGSHCRGSDFSAGLGSLVLAQRLVMSGEEDDDL